MKKTILTNLFILLGLTFLNAQKITRVEPLSWWTDMQCPLTLMFHGENLQDAQISVQKREGKKWVSTQGIVITGQHNAESINYLFADVAVKEAGEYLFTLSKGKKKTSIPYTIATRRSGSSTRQSFTSADVLYLLMPDRFADGDYTNNSTNLTREKGDKNNINGRYGGDIQGIIDSLDYIKSLGVTAIWSTPLLLDDEEAWSYHGYACADYYHIDPRFGSNQLYQEMVSIAHEKGLKFIMDIVTNHCGLAHWWIQDLPYRDWIHQHAHYTQTNNVFTTNYDTNASQYDLHLNETGWFDTHMPDMNLDNPDLLHYFKQWAIWWIEYADLDGLRVDTYPYNEKTPMSEWCKAIRTEYPNINIVGECWTRPAAAVAYWQADARNHDNFNSNLPTVMDFPVEEAIRQALENQGKGWGEGMARVYDAVSQDYQYADVNKLLLFVGNHDMDHIADIVYNNDLRRVKLGITLIATLRGIPQLYAGDEFGQRSIDMSKGHSGLRQPLTPETQLTSEQTDLLNYHRLLFNYRLNQPVLHHGKTMHFMSRDNTYAYFRYSDSDAVFVFINASEQEVAIPWEHYQEILTHYNAIGNDIVSGESINTNDTYNVAPLSALVVKLTK
ncbi:MAG: alpha-amylase family glycosyl hydrolase [Paludibacter sp.]|nr:alpha-amylase family glycosyl hydrolase [Bacteroidales bacterium]MCM1068966.1 alpha-amylase family glycosyl hydrolase [Prevotella sp.]MCM1353629.1 alpha-amylase family glycosyl hydrolase [Bacteroides sp.]MCM1442022.1 alpha-amylase family glycosyl hydrolase [Muribaculum sp.]MCM1481522.1 alpha-amylase family glycosyl hydrolase [Paludibacter sp.]